MGYATVNSREFDRSIDIYTFSSTMDRGAEANTPSLTYSGVPAKYMNPLKTDVSEVYEGNQEVAKLRGSWMIRDSSSRTITADDMACKVGNDYHMITGVREWKGSRNILILDTILRDNQTT